MHVQAFTVTLQALNCHVPRQIPVSWYGVASEVRLMGSFDSWTRGFNLSAEEINDSVFTTFRAVVPLLPVIMIFDGHSTDIRGVKSQQHCANAEEKALPPGACLLAPDPPQWHQAALC